MNFKKMNKKAQEEWLTPWMFVVWLVIGIAIVIAVSVFYLSFIDSRDYEAKILGDKIISCISDSGKINPEFFQEFDVYSRCGLEKEIFSSKGLFYFKVSIYDVNDKNYAKSISGGNLDFEVNCGLTGDSMPKCQENKVLVSYEGRPYILEVLTGSNQIGGKL